MIHYNNAVLSLTSVSTPDPYITCAGNNYYLTFTAGDRVELWSANNLTDFHDHAEKHVLWRPPHDTDHSNDLWAPELHLLQGRWYIYVAACHPKHGNKSHRMYILGGPPGDQNPSNGPWEFLGPFRDMKTDQWAIDGTVITLDSQLYFVYSGWPLDNPNESDLIQRLFIIRLADPVTAASEPVEICRPKESFERTGDHGINEGPQYLQSADGSWRGIVYSCAGSWTKDYKMNTLRFTGGDPLDPGSWEKSMKPLIQNGPHDKGPWGPGHGSFMHVGNEIFGVYHATDGPGDGWGNRRARMQRLVFTHGEPSMGGCVGPLGGRDAFFGHKSDDDPAGSAKASSMHSLKGFMKKLKDEL